MAEASHSAEAAESNGATAGGASVGAETAGVT